MSGNSALISIAMCTYNGEKFIEQQMDSLLAQTYRPLEIIISDDCSSDKTIDILREYEKKNAHITLFTNEKNIGFNKNFERAISFCTGAYIAICDQDDIWHPEKINTLYHHINDNWLIFSNSEYINQDNKNIGATLLKNFTLKHRTFKSLLLYNYVTGHTTLFHRNFLPYLLPLPQIDYYDWWMGFIATYHHKIAYCDQLLTSYRIHENSFIQYKNSNTVEQEIHAKETLEHLQQIAHYKNLENIDYTFIYNLLNAFTKQIPFKLIGIIYKNYPLLFPDLKRRTGLSLLNFAIKFALKKTI